MVAEEERWRIRGADGEGREEGESTSGRGRGRERRRKGRTPSGAEEIMRREEGVGGGREGEDEGKEEGVVVAKTWKPLVRNEEPME